MFFEQVSRIFWFIILLFKTNVLLSQVGTITHTVITGENLMSIARKYNIKTESIFELNPAAKIALKVNDKLIIPAYQKPKSNPATHIVQPQETVYGIAKQYNISVLNLKKFNPSLQTTDLQQGQILLLSEQAQDINSKKIANETSHIVAPKETKFSIAKKHNIKIEDLEAANPQIINGLRTGDVLKVDSLTKNQSSKNDDQTFVYTNNNAAENNKVQRILSRALSQINIKYSAGGTTPLGFDCSGLISFVFENSNINIPRTSFEQSKTGKKVVKSDAKIGDLIFFGTNGIAQINHVGLIVEINNLEIKFIHASVHSGVIISSLQEPYYKKDFVQINNVFD